MDRLSSTTQRTVPMRATGDVVLPQIADLHERRRTLRASTLAERLWPNGRHPQRKRSIIPARVGGRGKAAPQVPSRARDRMARLGNLAPPFAVRRLRAQTDHAANAMTTRTAPNDVCPVSHG